MELCACCQNRFPASSLAKAAYTGDLAAHLAAMQGLLDQQERAAARAGDTDPEGRHIRLTMARKMEDLHTLVNDEFAALRSRAAVADEHRASREKDLEAANTHIAALCAAQDSAKQPKSARFSSVAALPPSRGVPQPNFNGTVASYQMKKMTTAFDLVSASIYSLLESLAIDTRADTALLWIRPRGVVGGELVAPFVVGRDLSVLRSSAPYRVTETSLPVAVRTAGTAVNVRPVPSVRDDRATQDINLGELIERANVAQLVVPVFNRYAAAGNAQSGSVYANSIETGGAVIGVIHLIGSPRCPFPFSRRNEDTAMHAATLLAFIMSTHYNVMAGEWGNHFFQPTTLHATSTFHGRLDLRADEKAVDDFTPTPTLIYRCEKDLDGPADPREAAIALKAAIGRAAVPTQPVLTRVRDLHRHAATMETNWMAAVDATTRLEYRIGALDEEALTMDVRELRQTRDAAAELAAATAPPRWAAAGAAAASAAHAVPPQQQQMKKALDASLNSVHGNVRLAPPISLTNGPGGGKSESVLKVSQLDSLEAIALRRLEHLGIDTTPFASASPH